MSTFRIKDINGRTITVWEGLKYPNVPGTGAPIPHQCVRYWKAPDGRWHVLWDCVFAQDGSCPRDYEPVEFNYTRDRVDEDFNLARGRNALSPGKGLMPGGIADFRLAGLETEKVGREFGKTVKARRKYIRHLIARGDFRSLERATDLLTGITMRDGSNPREGLPVVDTVYNGKLPIRWTSCPDKCSTAWEKPSKKRYTIYPNNFRGILARINSLPGLTRGNQPHVANRKLLMLWSEHIKKAICDDMTREILLVALRRQWKSKK